MKAQPVKATVAAKTTGAAVKAKPAAKAVVKPAAKSVMKAAVTAPAQPVVQSKGTPAAPKPVAKATPVKAAIPCWIIQDGSCCGTPETFSASQRMSRWVMLGSA